MKIDDAIEEINGKPTFLLVFLGAVFSIPQQALTLLNVGPNLYGFIPYNNQWRCLENSTRCTTRSSGGVYNRDTLCGTGSQTPLQLGVDFIWATDGRTSYAMEYDLYCDREWIFTMINSLYFVGAMIGLSIGGTIMDLYGRKFGLRLSLLVTIVAIIVEVLPSSVSHLAVFILARILIGAGGHVYFSGIQIYTLELCPNKLRPYGTLFYAFSWNFGYLLMVFFGYFIKIWNIFAGVPGIILILSMVLLRWFPESPKHELYNARNEAKAKKALSWFIKVNKSDFDLDAVELEMEDTGKKDVDAEQPSLWENLKEFFTYSEMGWQTLILIYQWCIASFLYYGFTFSWSKLSSNLYIGYLLAAIGDSVSAVIKVTIMFVVKRRPAVLMAYVTGGVCFLLAMIKLQFPGNVISFEQLICLVGAVAVAVAWGLIFLHGVEAAPTTHRAKINSYASFGARIGAICGTQATLLFNWSKNGSFIVFGVASITAGLLALRMPETKDITPPATAKDVRRHYYTVVRGNKINVTSDDESEERCGP